MNAAQKIITTKYVELDNAIIKVVGAGKNRHEKIGNDPDVRAAAAPFTKDGKPLYRVIDGRTQALRKRGILKYDQQNGWRLWDV